MKYISIIKSYYPSLSKTEKKVADYILKEKGKIIYQTLIEISKNVNVGEATIIRFVKKIGFDGFQDLKLEVAKEDKLEIEENYENYIDESAANMAKSIDNTKAILNINQLNLAIDMIMKAKRVYSYGVGSSGLTSDETKNRFMRLGVMVNSVTDTHFQMMYSSLCGEDDVILAFSLSGYTKDILESINLAKKNNTKIVAVTSHGLSPIAQLGDCVILTSEKENPLDGGSLLGRISQLYILDLLCTGYSLKNREDALNLKEKTAESIIGKSAN